MAVRRRVAQADRDAQAPRDDGQGRALRDGLAREDAPEAGAEPPHAVRRMHEAPLRAVDPLEEPDRVARRRLGGARQERADGSGRNVEEDREQRARHDVSSARVEMSGGETHLRSVATDGEIALRAHLGQHHVSKTLFL